MDEIDLDFTEIELSSDIDNLKLLRKQLNSVQSIRYEQQRKDELIARLRDRIQRLEAESRSYEDIKEHVLLQSRHVMKIRDQEMREKFSALHQQMEGLRAKVQSSEEEQARNLDRLNEAKAVIAKFQAKLGRAKDSLEAERERSSELQAALDGCRREATEKEAALSLEIHSADGRLLQLQTALREKHAALEALRDEHELRASQLSAKFFEELKAAKDEASRWKHMHEDLDKSSREWRQFQESALSHEKLTSTQLHHTCTQLREEGEMNSRQYTEDIAERNAVIEELKQALHSTSDELGRQREARAAEAEHRARERDSEAALEVAELQKEVGALQVGLCLQKEMKDRVQHSLNHLKSCLRSLALDLARPSARGFDQLCDLFDRLLVSGALVSDGGDGDNEKSSQNWEKHVSHMHSYINQHSVLVGGDPSQSPGVARYGRSLGIDSDFLSVIKTMRELLGRVQGERSASSRREITQLVEHVQLIRSDLDQADLLMLSLVSQLMDEGHVDAAELRDRYRAPESVVNSFNEAGDLEGERIQFHSGSKQRAVLHAKLCTGVAEAIRSAKLARSSAQREKEEVESLRHELDILRMKLEIENRHHRKEDSSNSPLSRRRVDLSSF